MKKTRLRKLEELARPAPDISFQINIVPTGAEFYIDGRHVTELEYNQAVKARPSGEKANISVDVVDPFGHKYVNYRDAIKPLAPLGWEEKKDK